MNTELDRYHGVVLRQILVVAEQDLRIGVASQSGRIDSYYIQGAAMHIKHSTKRLPPWRFSYLPDNLRDLWDLRHLYFPVWAMLVCGHDGVVGLSLSELSEIIDVSSTSSVWIRVRRSRNSMYRVSGSSGELSRAKPRGVEPFLQDIRSQRRGEGYS